MLTSNIGAYTDIAPEIGILGTGTIDLQSGVLYVVAELSSKVRPSSSCMRSISAPAERMNGPITIEATASGTGAGSAATG
jgi:hypothetical protein